MKKGVYVILLVALFVLPVLVTIVQAQSTVYWQDDFGNRKSGSVSDVPKGIDYFGSAEEVGTDYFAIGTGGSQVVAPSKTAKTVAPYVYNPKSLWPDFIQHRLYLWEHNSISDPLVGPMMKYLLLFIVIILIYSALASAEFPESAPVRIILSVVVGFMATFAITTKELLTMLNSYSALGVTFAVFLPLVILGFFTMMMAKKMNPTGIFLQKIAWLIYSVYLFIKTGMLWLMDASKVNSDSAWVSLLSKVFNPIIPKGEDAEKLLTSYDKPMLFILAIVSIAVFVFMVWKNDYVNRWLTKQETESEREAYEKLSERSKAKMQVDAATMQNAGKKE